MANRRGMSYRNINRIYDQYARSGLSNREIWRRYIYPKYYISERTFYNIMNATVEEKISTVALDMPSLFDTIDYGVDKKE